MPSAILIAYGLLVAVVIGVPLAIIAAVRPQRVVDNGVRLMATFSFAMPLFWLGLVLALRVRAPAGLVPGLGLRRRHRRRPADADAARR